MIRLRVLFVAATIVCVIGGASWYLIHMNLISSPGAASIHPGYSPDACWITETKCLSGATDSNFLDIKENRAIAPDDHFAFDPFSEGLLLAKHHSRWGYRDVSGKIVIPAQFIQARPFREHRAAIALYIKGRGLLWGFVDRSGRVVVRPQFRRVRNFSEGVAAVRDGHGKNFRWGFIDPSGKMVIPACFHDATAFSEGLAGASLEKKYGYIDHAGKFLIAPQFEHAFRFSDGRARISSGTKFGFIDKTGKVVVPIRYYKARDFAEQRAAVFVCGEGCAGPYSGLIGKFENQGRWGYIDPAGKLVVPGRYTNAEDFAEGLAAVTGAGASYIDKQGNVAIVTSRYHGSFYHGLARIGYRYKTYIDKTGTPVSPPYLTKIPSPYPTPSLGGAANACSYRTVFCPPARMRSFEINGKRTLVPELAGKDPWDEDRFPVEDAYDLRSGYRNGSGKLVVPYQFSIARPFTEHRAAVRTHLLDSTHRFFLWGYIDSVGQMVIAPQFEDAKGFSEGLAAVAVGPGAWPSWGFVGPSGKMVIPATFDKAEDFSEGLAMVRAADDTYGYIDHSGAFAIAPQFQHAFSFSNGRARIECGSKTHPKFGYIDKTGKIVIACRYDDAHDFSEGRAAVLLCPKRPCANEQAEGAIDSEAWGRWGYIDANGKIAVPFRYRWANDFFEGLASVTTEESEGQYIDQHGNIVILTSEDHDSFIHGIARIGNEKNTTYIDKTGRPLIVPLAWSSF
jgi:hypothetical protein